MQHPMQHFSGGAKVVQQSCSTVQHSALHDGPPPHFYRLTTFAFSGAAAHAAPLICAARSALRVFPSLSSRSSIWLSRNDCEALKQQACCWLHNRRRANSPLSKYRSPEPSVKWHGYPLCSLYISMFNVSRLPACDWFCRPTILVLAAC